MIHTVLVVIVVTIFTSPLTLGQNVGDHRTAGFDNSRTYLNSDAGDLRPPFRVTGGVGLDPCSSLPIISCFIRSVKRVDSIIVSENNILIGEGGFGYSLYKFSTGLAFPLM
ncbi:MAG TPA: hypothetical protein VGK99_23355, partial [Acidobacteriota bacterium]